MCSIRFFLLTIVAASLTGHVLGQPQPGLLPPPAGPTLATPPEPLPIPVPAPTNDVNSTPWQPPAGGVGAAPAATAPAAAATPPTAPVPEPSTPPPADGAAKAATDPTLPGELLIEPQPRWYERALMLVPVPWNTGIELGVNGSAGTTDSLSLRTGGYVKQESRYAKFNMSSYYNRTASGGEITQNNAQFDVRNDWLMDEKSPWTLFGTNNVYYDEFKAFDVQANVDAGLGYRFFHEKDLELIGRVGGGTSREFGGPDDRWVPESLLGAEYNQKIFPTQKVSAKVDYFPDMDQLGEFRLVGEAAWEVELVQPSNLSLKFSATDRYDSTPNGAEPNTVNYSALMLLKL